MAWIALLVWMVTSILLGLPLARHALRGENRLVVLLAMATVGGYCLQSVVLILLWGVVPLGTAYYATVLASMAASVFLASKSSPSKFSWGTGRAEAVLVAAALVAFGFLAHRFYTIGYSSWDAEALYWHAGTVGWLSRGTFPPTAVLEPDSPLHYRLGTYPLPAAVVAITGERPPEVMAASLAMFVPLLAVSLLGASMRFSTGIRTGLLAAFLALFGGSLLPIFLLAKQASGADSGTHVAQEYVSGLVWLGNNLDMLHNNVTITAGFVAFSCALWLVWEAIHPGGWNVSRLLLSASSLGFLGLTNEVHFVALLGGVGLAAAATVILDRADTPSVLRTRMLPLVFVCLGSGIVLFLRGGILGGAALGGEGEGSVKLVLNTAHFGSVPVAPGVWNPPFVPFLSPDVQIDTNLAIVAIPLMVVLAIRWNDRFALAGVSAAIAPMVAWLTIYPALTVWDGFRFAQAGLSIYLTMIPFLLTRARLRVPALTLAPANLGTGLLLMALTGIHLVLAAWLALAPASQSAVDHSSPDYPAAEMLRSSRDTSRVLVPLIEGEDKGHLEIYRNDDLGVALRTMSGVTTHAVPIGHNAYDDLNRYAGTYRRAGMTFEPKDLRSLGVDWVYVLPARLSASQRTNLSRAAGAGTLTEASRSGVPGSHDERILFRVR